MGFFTKTNIIFDELIAVGRGNISANLLNEKIDGYLSSFFDLNSYLYICIDRPNYQNSDLDIVSNLEYSRLKKYRDPALAFANPFIKKAYESSLPHFWEMPKDMDPKTLALIAEITEDGQRIENTFSIPVRGRFGECGIFSAELNDASVLSDENVYLAFAKLSYFTNRLHDFLVVADNDEPKYQLTSRQAEILQWAAKGKSSNEIASILNLSGNTVHKHLNGARIALDSMNTTQAVATALMHHLIKIV